MKIRSLRIIVAIALIALGLGLAVAAPEPAGEILHLRIEGVINPIKVRYIENAFAEAQAAKVKLIIVSINTPGGLVDSMEKIVATIVNSPIPVVTFVSPQAATATSAGTFIVLAGDVAAMVPGTTIGSAHPVGGQGEKIEGPMEDKILNLLISQARSLAERRNRNVHFAEESIRSSMNLAAEAALDTKVIDLIANDLDELVRKLDGFVISHENRKDTLATAGLPIRFVPLSRAENFLDAIANPSIAYILMTLGVMGLIYEFSNPGIGLGAVMGSICLLLGLLSMSALPIHLGGVLLLILGLIMLGLEFKIQSGGLLTVGGVIALILGSFILVDAGQYYGAVQEVKFGVVLPLVGGIAVIAGVFLYLTIRTLRSPQRMGFEGMNGLKGTAKTALAPRGTVFVDGALWEAESLDGEIASGERIEVAGRDGAHSLLKVRKLSDASGAAASARKE
jgi:membrane-bound serine protease (ClpP class)